MSSRNCLVTGGAGFIGSALVRFLLAGRADKVLVVDNLSYAGNLANLADVTRHPGYAFVRADIGDAARMRALLEQFRPDRVFNLAAESHVDRSIDGPAAFVQTNVVGTFALLQEALSHWRGLPAGEREAFRFVHVSTDEVYGSLEEQGFFHEDSPYRPNSPYSASKAASDHFVRAWHHTYGLPTIVTNCSNNYGPCQYPEKLIPLTILNAREGRALPVYGRGDNVRDWLYVDDHAAALALVAERGIPGQTYAIGGQSERRNIDVVRQICQLLDCLQPSPDAAPRDRLIRFVADRPGHDRRYAIDAGKIERELGWRPAVSFDDGLAATVRWYLDNEPWWRRLREASDGGARLGLGAIDTVRRRRAN